MVVGEVKVIPLGEGVSVSRFVRAAIEALRQAGVKVIPGAMSTVIEAGSIEEVFQAVKLAHEAVFKEGAKRVVTSVVVDDRRDKPATVESKLKAIREN